MNLVPLFLVSLTSVGIETALTRYFAVAGWSDYGYWIISIVMAGLAFSGVTLALASEYLVKRADLLLAILPAMLLASAAIGYSCTILNPFNPLQLQNPATYLTQLGNIALYYVALLPFFFLAGLFIGLMFVTNTDRIERIYAADLIGAGIGSFVVLGLMYLVTPFVLIPALLPVLSVAGGFANRYRKSSAWASVLVLCAAEALLWLGPQASTSQYKPIYAPLHTPDARVVAVRIAPQGDYQVLDDFTERVNTDISNDAGMLGYPDPPRSFGLYRDGIRIASLPKPGQISSGYAQGALDALPYKIRPNARVLLAGASGGFRILELLALGASHVDAVEPEPVLYSALLHGIGPSPDFSARKPVHLLRLSPVAAIRNAAPYDLVDLSGDFLDAAPANVESFTRQAFSLYLSRLSPTGILSIPVSIQDFPVYALRMLSTVRAALLAEGVANPAPHVLVYRSAWNARILVSPAVFSPNDIREARKWCDDRSFDVSYYAGIDVAAARPDVYNDLPAVSFDAGTVTAEGPDDSIADEAQAILAGQTTVSGSAFNLSPVSDDRPQFYSVLRLGNLRVLLARLQILPQSEIGALVNLAVLAQAVVFAALILLVPLAAPRIAANQSHKTGLVRPIFYFSALAMGFLFVEIFAIEKASVFLDDRAMGFSLVISFMLFFSGGGSMLSARFKSAPQRGIWGACLIIVAWSSIMFLTLPAIMLASDWLPQAVRVLLVLTAIAPVSVALGMPFPLGLGQVSDGSFLPWAWGLNGAFSVVATPLANLIARNLGYHAVLTGAVLLYVLAAITFPAIRRENVWFTSPKSAAGE